MRRIARKVAPIALLTFVVLCGGAALACRGGGWWRTGADLSKLKSGEIAVTAEVIDSYQSSKRFKSIMGYPYGVIYHIRIVNVLGSARNHQLSAGLEIMIRSLPSVCEAFRPNTSSSGDTTLVLEQMPDGIYNLVGGRNRDDG